MSKADDTKPASITIDDTKYVRADSIPNVPQPSGDKVIVRGDRSGVFYGTLTSRNGGEVELGNCRRIWYWDGAASISQLARDGTSAPDKCKFPPPVARQLILDAIEVIPTTKAAEESIEAVKEWKQ